VRVCNLLDGILLLGGVCKNPALISPVLMSQRQPVHLVTDVPNSSYRLDVFPDIGLLGILHDKIHFDSEGIGEVVLQMNKLKRISTALSG
jgi:hypothetical protein